MKWPVIDRKHHIEIQDRLGCSNFPMASQQSEPKSATSCQLPDVQQGDRLTEGGKQALGNDEQDGGYGWVCVICQLLITASTWGVNGVSQQ